MTEKPSSTLTFSGAYVLQHKDWSQLIDVMWQVVKHALEHKKSGYIVIESVAAPSDRERFIYYFRCSPNAETITLVADHPQRGLVSGEYDTGALQQVIEQRQVNVQSGVGRSYSMAVYCLEVPFLKDAEFELGMPGAEFVEYEVVHDRESLIQILEGKNKGLFEMYVASAVRNETGQVSEYHVADGVPFALVEKKYKQWYVLHDMMKAPLSIPTHTDARSLVSSLLDGDINFPLAVRVLRITEA